MAGRQTQAPPIQLIESLVAEILRDFPRISLAILFGSMATGRADAESDFDIAVAAAKPLTVDEKMMLVERLAVQFGRPVDLVDLKQVSEPLLGQILRHGRKVAGSERHYAELLTRHLFEQADFMPYRTRILEERRQAWIERS